MAKSGWLGLELLPAHVKIVLGVFSAMTMVFVITLSLLPEDQFGFSSVVFNVVGYKRGESIPTHPIAIFVSDTAPPPDLTANSSPSAGSKDLEKNSSSAIEPVTSDSSVVHSRETTPSAAAPKLKSEHKRFLSPLLSPGVGAGNQLMEFISAAVIARATSRTLCLPPFFSGPIKHSHGNIQIFLNGAIIAIRRDEHFFSEETRV